MGKKRPKHFKEKSFIQATTARGHADKSRSIPSLVRPRFSIEKDSHVHREILALKGHVYWCSDLTQGNQ